MASLIQPRVLKGFRDILPENEIERSGLMEKITNVYRSYGFVPIDTPVLEYSEILLRKSNGETEQLQILSLFLHANSAPQDRKTRK